ncbi:armadillo-type protein [Umbelopsis sp. AD052]|nr:armadillo-type protein [Umbelopsis sp. AD052]
MLETDMAITPDLIPSTTPDSMQTGSSPPTRQPKFMSKVSQLFNRKSTQADGKLASIDDEGIQTTTITEQQQQQNYRRRRTKSGSSNADSAISKIDSMFSVESRVSSELPDFNAIAIENKLGSRTVHIGAVRQTRGEGSGSQQSDRDLNEAFENLMKEYALPPNLRPSLEHLTREQKSTLLRSSQLARKSSALSLTAPFATLRKSKQLLLPGTVRDAQGRHQVQRRRPTHAYATHARAPQGVGAHILSGKAKSPRYFADLLMHSTCRDLELAEIMDLRVYLRNGIASWTTEFLKAGGYDSLTSTLAQIKNIAKRAPEDDKLLQQLVKCIKALTTHELGIHKLLGDKAPLKIIRDLLFSSSINPKRRSFFVFEISTRALMLDVLCTLASLQTQGQPVYVHGYDILQQLLLDTPEDLAMQAQEVDEKPVARASHYPFPMTLKEAQDQECTDPTTSRLPRYSAWMRELAFTVDKSIEPITFLSQVLDYRFESAFKQMKIQPDAKNVNWKQAVNEQIASNPAAATIQPAGSVMVDEGVVDYLITHLRLMCTLITTPPTTYRGLWDSYSQEALRMELMESGFDKIARSLQSCPHPTLYSTYIKYLQPLLQPWATSTVRPEQPPIAKEVMIAPSEPSPPPSRESEAELSDDTAEMPVRNGAQAPLFGLSTSDETLWDDDFYDMDDDAIDEDSFFDEPLDDVFLQDDSDSFSEEEEEEDSSESIPRPQARETWKTSTKRT